MENQDYSIRDLRDNFYWIDNVIIDDFKLNPVQLSIYNVLCRHSKQDDQKCFFALRKFCENFKVSPKKAKVSFEALIEKKLIKVIGKTERGSKIICILKPFPIENTNGDRFPSETLPFPNENTTVSHRKTNNTNKQNVINNIKDLPKPRKKTKQEKEKELEKLENEYLKQNG